MQITEPEITAATAAKLGLNSEEFEKIKLILGRTPNFMELKMYAVMWSEPCSYKNSIKWLKTLPREGKRMLGNTGLVDIGDGIACALKIKSLNYPSAIEPDQGAAIGVEGIHRDIFTMGARPIVALNSLRFGNLDSKHTKDLAKYVVKGIGDYGNSLGVATFGGEVFFDDCYLQNNLINLLSVGIVRVGETVSARADGPGNPVFIVGLKGGKDEIDGPKFTATDRYEASHENLHAVQVGEPFQEKLLLEASLEAIKTGAVVGMEGIGAAGIICPTAEMSAKAGTGMHLDLTKVPTRQANMQAWEILLSESHEWLLLVGKAGEEQMLFDVFEKWDLECVQIGEVTDLGMLAFFYSGEKVAEVPAKSLVRGGDAPVYEPDYSKPTYLAEVNKFRLNKIETPKDYKAAARKLFSLPNLVSKRWFFEQFDSMVRTNNLSTNAPSDASVIRIKGSKKSLVVTMDCNPAYVHADPYTGAMIVVAEATRNITCAGGVPVAITNCLNFGNPNNQEVYYQFVHAIKGIGDACRKFSIPVTGSQVSFCNQAENGDKTEPIFPTPTIGMLGILEDASHHTTLNFKAEGDVIYMLGNIMNDLGSSEYLRNVLGVKLSPAPYFDLHEEFELQQLIRQMIRKNWLSSAHDVSIGGLFTNLIESTLASGLGCNIETVDTFRKDCFLFGESQSRVVISLPSNKEDELQNFLVNSNVSFTKLGEVFGTEVVIDGEKFGSVEEWKLIFENTLGEKFDN